MTAGVAGDSDRGELRTRSVANGLAGIVPVEVPVEELVLGRVDLSSLDALRHRLAVVSAGNFDVECLILGQKFIEDIKMF